MQPPINSKESVVYIVSIGFWYAGEYRCGDQVEIVWTGEKYFIHNLTRYLVAEISAIHVGRIQSHNLVRFDY